jgi:hypothetical protein
MNALDKLRFYVWGVLANAKSLDSEQGIGPRSSVNDEHIRAWGGWDYIGLGGAKIVYGAKGPGFEKNALFTYLDVRPRFQIKVEDGRSAEDDFDIEVRQGRPGER